MMTSEEMLRLAEASPCERDCFVFGTDGVSVGFHRNSIFIEYWLVSACLLERDWNNRCQIYLSGCISGYAALSSQMFISSEILQRGNARVEHPMNLKILQLFLLRCARYPELQQATESEYSRGQPTRLHKPKEKYSQYSVGLYALAQTYVKMR